MSDMWTSINLDDFEVRPIAEWPAQDALSIFDRGAAQEFLDDGDELRDYIVRAMSDTLEADVVFFEFNDNGDNLYAAGGSNYETDSGKTLACELTEVTTGTARIREEWTGMDPNTTETVYRDGKEVEEEGVTSVEVPKNLPELVAAGRKALADKVLVVNETGKPHVYPVSDALQALVDALDPQGAQ
ncbi:hypothetical protein [Leifsonia aquatica]|uniref:hypothetical protein n=1 Tax=Leifsonia aquatica TaxID=144185 RepID=UPI0004680B81|nr:hypothetical protein [Leifsonia aquatica]